MEQLFEEIIDGIISSETGQNLGPLSDADLEHWIIERRKSVNVSVEQQDVNSLCGWRVDPQTHNIQHESGKFFSIIGTRVTSSLTFKKSWCQPIIDQPEIGFLGFITKKIGGVVCFLLQAKIEPGNIGAVQLSPTIQATKSNFMQVHGGSVPKYLEYFDGSIPTNVVVDHIQTEQGARFFKKRNRNIVVYLSDSQTVELSEDFVWVTLKQIKKLMGQDNLVNMDTRTVVATLTSTFFSSANFVRSHRLTFSRCKHLSVLEMSSERSLHQENRNKIASWLSNIKFNANHHSEKIVIKDTNAWSYLNGNIARHDGKYFSVIGADVNIQNREVKTWSQPLIKPANDGLIAFIVKLIDGELHFLIQAKAEAGTRDIIEIAPTVQCVVGNYTPNLAEYNVPYLEYILNAKPDSILFDTVQSEEGGRFYCEQNRNIIIMADESFSKDPLPLYNWVSASHLASLIAINGLVNISARTLFATLKFEKI